MKIETTPEDPRQRQAVNALRRLLRGDRATPTPPKPPLTQPDPGDATARPGTHPRTNARLVSGAAVTRTDTSSGKEQAASALSNWFGGR